LLPLFRRTGSQPVAILALPMIVPKLGAMDFGGLAQTLLLNVCDARKAQFSQIVPLAPPVPSGHRRPHISGSAPAPALRESREQSENVYENKGRLRKPNAQRPPRRAVINSGRFVATERLESAIGLAREEREHCDNTKNSGNEAKKSLKTKEVTIAKCENEPKMNADLVAKCAY
jgi:hypothetical protein